MQADTPRSCALFRNHRFRLRESCMQSQQVGSYALNRTVLPCISPRRPCIEAPHHGGNLRMSRLSIYVVGVTAFLAAWAIFRNQQKTRALPAKKAAEMLQEAWADYHTRA